MDKVSLVWIWKLRLDCDLGQTVSQGVVDLSAGGCVLALVAAFVLPLTPREPTHTAVINL